MAELVASLAESPSDVESDRLCSVQAQGSYDGSSFEKLGPAKFPLRRSASSFISYQIPGSHTLRAKHGTQRKLLPPDLSLVCFPYTESTRTSLILKIARMIRLGFLVEQGPRDAHYQYIKSPTKQNRVQWDTYTKLVLSPTYSNR